MRRILRTVVVFAGVLLVLAAGGAVYQAVATANDAEAFPAPGWMVDLGGFSLHIDCTGQGSPTVILDHAGGSNSAQWGLIQPEIAAHTRVCSYDRGGFGWSEEGPEPRDAMRAADELATLLTGAGVPGPYVLVGHSYGGFVARLFADRHPNEVVGMVLLDPARPFDHPLVPVEMNALWKEEDATLFQLAPAASRLGLMRLVGEGINDLPEANAAAFAAMNDTARFWDAMAAVAEAMPATSTAILALPPPTMPTIVLSAGQPDAEDDRRIWTMINAEIVADAPDGAHRLIEAASHLDFALRRDVAAITVSTILEMVARVRAAAPVPEAPAPEISGVRGPVLPPGP